MTPNSDRTGACICTLGRNLVQRRPGRVGSPCMAADLNGPVRSTLHCRGQRAQFRSMLLKSCAVGFKVLYKNVRLTSGTMHEALGKSNA